VNPNGAEVTVCEFQYGLTIFYEKSVPCTPSPGSGESAVAVSASVTGLTPNKTYYYIVVATNAFGTGESIKQSFKTLSSPTIGAGSASGITQTEATLRAAVNPNGEEVTECNVEYGETIAYGSSAPCTTPPGAGEKPVVVGATVTGLNINRTYHFRIVASNAGGMGEGPDATFKSLPKPPTVVTEAPSALTPNSATFNGMVNPNGGEGTTCKFEYGSTLTYGSSVPCSSSPGSGENPVAVMASVTGLTGGVEYHVRVVGINAGGTTLGSDVTFKTVFRPPKVVTEAASAVTGASATLNGTVNPNGEEVTACKFEYGTTESYGSTATCMPSSPGSGESPVAVMAPIAGLAPGTTYQFRVVATNASGTSYGSDASFKTRRAPEHWYRNGALLSPAKALPILSFGGSTDVVQVSALGEVHCKNVAAGSVENPSGGGAGVGKTVVAAYYSCAAPQCEAAVKEKFGTAGRGEIRTENLPNPIGPNGSEGWEEELLLEAGSPASVRERVGLAWSSFPSGGQSGTGATHESPPGMMRLTVICAIPSLNTTAAEAIFEGALEPEVGEAAGGGLNGMSAGHPSGVRFAGTSTGVLHSEAGGELSGTGTTKYLGYTSQEVIAVKE
jgi:hypothetical protein